MSPFCVGCGATLGSPVAFCPFCGIVQRESAPVPPPPRRPEPVVAEEPPAPEAASPPAAPAVPADQVRSVPPPGEPERVEPRFSPAPAAASVPPEPDLRAIPTNADKEDARWNRNGTPARRSQPRSLARPPNPNRAGAIRKLLAAAFVFVCAAILWRTLVITPHGTLVVHLTRPASGSVLVDGVASGTADSPIDVAPGRHRIGFAADGFETPERILHAETGRTSSLTLSPQPRPAELVLDTDPTGAAVTLDGRPIGHTPLRRTLSAGRHRIVATAPGLQRTMREIDLRPGAPTALSLSLPPLPLRRMRFDAPAGRWSDPVRPDAGTRFTLLFRDPIRVRIAGRVVLLQPGAPVELGALDSTGLAVTSATAQDVPVQMLIAAPPGEGTN
ncbi:PEGA domain-containing protein [Acetobacteraceae bacterium KSS8]|uniref:PEGA domain-containing protein n=1 Tax=Endosaccharibacter trunci TaxID=2812733 RepID=A0ABT1W962_9PROT|nr:PEGA domain-containing protein [Acetobacteraceae bacterium KSS8]